MTNTTYYKVLLNGKSFHGGAFEWSLPTAKKPGKWHEVTGPIVKCRTGFHLTNDPQKWWQAGAECFEVEIDGDVPATDDDKIAVAKCRLTRKLTDKELCDVIGIVLHGQSREAKSGETILVVGGAVTAWENSQVTARDNSQVTALGNSQVTALGNSQVTARDNSQVTALGNSQVTARGNSQVTAWDNSQVTARGNSQVTAWDNSQVTALGNSQVTARGNSQVTAWDNSQVTALADYATVIWWSGTVTEDVKDFAVVIDRRKYATIPTFRTAEVSA